MTLGRWLLIQSGLLRCFLVLPENFPCCMMPRQLQKCYHHYYVLPLDFGAAYWRLSVAQLRPNTLHSPHPPRNCYPLLHRKILLSLFQWSQVQRPEGHHPFQSQHSYHLATLSLASPP